MTSKAHSAANAHHSPLRAGLIHGEDLAAAVLFLAAAGGSGTHTSPRRTATLPSPLSSTSLKRSAMASGAMPSVMVPTDKPRNLYSGVIHAESRTGRRAWGRSRTPAAAPCARRTGAAATAAKVIAARLNAQRVNG